MRLGSILVIFTSTVAIISLSACAGFAASDKDISPQQLSLIDATCTNVMGLRKGETYFADCQDSLKQSMARKVEAEAMTAASDTCRGRGLAAGSAALSACILNEENAQASRQIGAASQSVKLEYADAPIQSGKSYYDVTPTIHWNRERYSCAQLGLMPGSGLFGECVASLDGALLPDQN